MSFWSVRRTVCRLICHKVVVKAGLQYRRGRVDRIVQPPSTPQDKPALVIGCDQKRIGPLENEDVHAHAWTCYVQLCLCECMCVCVYGWVPLVRLSHWREFFLTKIPSSEII